MLRSAIRFTLFLSAILLMAPTTILADEPAERLLRDVPAVVAAAWGPVQATGEPDTPQAGDIATAWASLSPDGQEEWLELSYEKAVVPTDVEIHENHCPGAVFKISAFDEADVETVIWKGKDPTRVGAPRGISKIKLETEIKTNRIRIYLNSVKVAGWNEIDAVGLIGRNEKRQWAVTAKASSTFADQPVHAIAGVAENIVGFAQPFGRPQIDDQTKRLIEEREKQLAAMIKRMRATEKELKQAREQIEKLKAENAKLRGELAEE